MLPSASPIRLVRMNNPRPQRSDARLNNARLLDAAEELLQERGADAPLQDIATRAGIGIGSLYRHFSNRHALLEALMTRFAEALDAHIQPASELDTGWEKIVAFIDGGIATTLEHPALYTTAEWLRRNDPQFQPSTQWNQIVIEAVAQAHREASLRPDVDATDLALIPHLMSSLAGFPEPMRSAIIARQRAILLSGLRPRAGEAEKLPALALSAAELVDLVGNNPD